VLRHTAFFLHRDTITPEQQSIFLRGLAYLRMECAGVKSGDYGADIYGGSARLREIKPYNRTPRWRARLEGPPSNYDVALHLDFDDESGLHDYNADVVHHQIGAYNESVCRPELTARIDWIYDGSPLIRKGLIRHTGMFLWTDEADNGTKHRTFDAVRRLQDAPGVAAVTLGQQSGERLTTDFDWIMDIQIGDRSAADMLLNGDLYAEVMKIVIPSTKHEWTARLTHVMHGE
jgi:hypothetical protein